MKTVFPPNGSGFVLPGGSVVFPDGGGNALEVSASGNVSLLAKSPKVAETRGLVAAQDGSLWGPGPFGPGRIHRFGLDGSVTEFVFPGTIGNLVAGNDGALYFLLMSNSGGFYVPTSLGRVATDGSITTTPLSGSTGSVTVSSDLVAAPDGTLWFTGTQAVGRITTTGELSVFTSSDLGSGLRDLIVGPDGALWGLRSVTNSQFGSTPLVRVGLDGVISLPMKNFGLAGLPAGWDAPLPSTIRDLVTVGSQLWAVVGPEGVGNVFFFGPLLTQPIGVGALGLVRLPIDAAPASFTDPNEFYSHLYPLETRTYEDLPYADVLARGADGSTWFTDGAVLGRLASDLTLERVQEPGIYGYGGQELVTSASGQLWAAQTNEASNHAGFVAISGDGSLTQFVDSVTFSFETDQPVVATQDNSLWRNGMQIGTPSTTGVIQKDAGGQLRFFPGVHDPFVGPGGVAWGRTADDQFSPILPGTGFSPVPIPSNLDLSTCSCIVTTPDGVMWTTAQGKVVRIDNDGTTTQFVSPAYTLAFNLTVATDGSLWFVDQAANGVIVRRSPDGTFTKYDAGSIETYGALTAADDGSVWIAGHNFDTNHDVAVRVGEDGTIAVIDDPAVWWDFNGDSRTHVFARGPSGSMFALQQRGPFGSVNAKLWQFSLQASDGVAPTIDLTVPADGATYASGRVPQADYSCSDDVTIAPACVGDVASGGALPSSLGVHTLTVTATDDAGNVATKSVSFTVVQDYVQASVGVGGMVATPDPPSAADPVQTAVTTPVGGSVSITEDPAMGAPPSGYEFVGQQVEITAPVASAESPLDLRFSLDSSLLAAAGVDASSVVVFRDGIPIADCVNPGVVAAAPDPCVYELTATTGGGAQLGVFSSHASTWNFGALSDVPNVIRVGASTVSEGNPSKVRSAIFAVTLDHPATQTVTVRYATASGTATSGVDFKAKSATLTFKPNTSGKTPTVKYVTVPILGDTAGEGDESFTLNLSNSTGGYSVATATATGTILDDDAGTGLRASVGDASIWEGDVAFSKTNAAKVLVSLSDAVPSGQTVSVKVSLVSGSATAGSDYKTFATKTLTFLAGQFQKTVTVPVYPDSAGEPDESLTVLLSSPSAGVSIGRATGTVTILNDD